MNPHAPRARLLALVVAVAVAGSVLAPVAAAARSIPASVTSGSTPAPGESVAPSPSPSPSPSPTPTVSPTPEVQVFGYYRTPWRTNPKIYRVTADGVVRAITTAQWRDAGSPRIRVAPVRYVRSSWSTTAYGLITWPHELGDTEVDQVVTLSKASVASAGSPRVRVVGHVPGTTYVRYHSGPADLYARTPDGASKKLTRAERASAGSPRASRVIPGGWFRAPWSSKVRFVRTDGTHRSVNAAEYRSLGRPQVSRARVEYARTPWSSTVYGLLTWPVSSRDRGVDQVARLDAAAVKRAGNPTPGVRHRIPGDSFVRLTTGPTVYHRMGSTLTPVTSSQWRAAGSPKTSRMVPPKPTYVRDILLVNKSHPLPSSFGDGLRPELVRAWERMRADAAHDGVSLRIISGFRSYAAQESIFASKVRQHGRAEAERRSARPGYSEHQTGLAIDLNSISQSWGDTAAGRWVAANAHRYGFVVRYPRGKESVTGYRWEPWHLRHVGVATATHLKRTGVTLDEYLGVTSRYP